MKARFSEPAADDLEQAVAYFRKHAPSVANDFAASVAHAIDLLEDNPYLAEETERSGIRRWYINRFRYFILYTIEGDELLIVHVWHAARRWPWEHDQDEE
jgi:toxin ParE1/3/4